MIFLSPLLALFTLTSGLSDSQVLQRDASGTAATVISGTSDASGRLLYRRDGGSWSELARIQAGLWHAQLPPLATGGPYTIQLRLEPAGGAAAAEKEYRDVFVGDLWVLAGQSNMVGRARINESVPTDPRVRMYSFEGAWQLAQHPIHERRGNNGAGLGLEFGRAMVRANQVPIGLIPCAKGGTSMEQWSPSLASQGEASLYGNLLVRVRAVGGRVTGVLWYQGENDTGTEASAVYKTAFQSFVRQLRADLGRPDLPFYYAQLSRYASPVTRPGRYYAEWNVVQEAQRVSEREIPNVRMVSTIDLELGDPIHLSTSALERLGRRFAKVVQGKTGPRVADIRWVSPSELRLRLTGVNGSLYTDHGRVFGFEVTDAQGEVIPLFFQATIDPATQEVVLRTIAKRVETLRPVDLWYGRGYDPICNLVDADDLALPAFGPWRLPAPPKQASVEATATEAGAWAQEE